MQSMNAAEMLALFLGLLVLATVSEAANFSLSVKNDARRVIDLGVFGYAADGRLNFELSEFFLHEVDEYATENEKIGFTLDRVVSASFARRERTYAIKETKKDKGEDLENICFVDDPTVTPPTRFVIPLQGPLHAALTAFEGKSAATDSTVQPASPDRQTAFLKKSLAGLTASFAIPADGEGLYALFFYNCKKMNKNKDPVHVTFRVKVSQYNIVDPLTMERSYLSIGEWPLPWVSVFFFLVFGGAAVQWLRVLFWSSSDVRRHVRPIHHFMSVLLVLKLLTLALHAHLMFFRARTGLMSGGWDYAFYFVQTVKGMALFTLIVLLGTGWSILKPFLSDRDRKLLLIVLPLQILANVALAVIEEQSEGSTSWARWRDALRLFDVGCCCAVLLPVVWSIRTLRDASGASKAAQRNLRRLQQFRTLYFAAVAFIYFTRIFLEFIGDYMPPRWTWVTSALYEVSAVIFYFYVGFQFQPTSESSIRSIDTNEDGEDEQEGQRHAEMDEVSKLMDGDDVVELTLDDQGQGPEHRNDENQR